MTSAGIPMPVVIEKDGSNEKAYDLYSRLLKDRIIFVGTPVDDVMANLIIGQLLFLEADDPEKDIFMYINSPGGAVTSGLGIYDTMRYVSPDIHTICVGQAVSMGCFLLAGGTKGKRYSVPHARIMMHQVSGGQQGPMPDVKIRYEEMERLNSMLMELFAENTGMSLEEVRDHFDRDKWMSPEQAMELGIIDAVHERSTRVVNDD
ncbi:MAG: ATP-dependent Clp protease proteolytic subunit [Candidatus Altiarchaeales archaeon]|nr:ATP-dependent Clp protease proteolytic subunit [Candidatus Altiarchaeales archaeon]